MKRIGTGAFYANDKLEEVILNDGLIEIGTNAFSDCRSLEVLSECKTVERVGFNAFRGTRWINNQPKPLYMGKALIKYYSDKPEESESEVAVIKDGILSISANAFQGNKRLKKLTIPDSVIYIGRGENLDVGAFSGCTNLEEIKLSKNIKEISNKMFYGCTSLRRIDIPDGVKIICDSAFNGCVSLAEINIPKSAEIIGYAFADTAWYDNLTRTTLVNKNLIKAIPDKDGKVTVPDGTVRIIPRLLYENQEVRAVSMPDTVENIGYCAFSKCSELTDINIPRKIVEIEDNAFEESSVQGDIIIPETVKK